MGVTFPNETPEYRRARAALLEREVALRRHMEAAAAELRALPPGGEVPEDYVFDGRPGPTVGAMAEVPLAEAPCPSCTALLDMWERTMPHFEGLGGNLVAVANAPIERVAAFARDKGWKHTRLLSAATNGFKRDYHGEDAAGQQVPIHRLQALARRAIRLHWASELVFEPSDPGQDMRHLGTVEPLCRCNTSAVVPGEGRHPRGPCA